MLLVFIRASVDGWRGVIHEPQGQWTDSRFLLARRERRATGEWGAKRPERKLREVSASGWFIAGSQRCLWCVSFFHHYFQRSWALVHSGNRFFYNLLWNLLNLLIPLLPKWLGSWFLGFAGCSTDCTVVSASSMGGKHFGCLGGFCVGGGDRNSEVTWPLILSEASDMAGELLVENTYRNPWQCQHDTCHDAKNSSRCCCNFCLVKEPAEDSHLSSSYVMHCPGNSIYSLDICLKILSCCLWADVLKLHMMFISFISVLVLYVNLDLSYSTVYAGITASVTNVSE